MFAYKDHRPDALCMQKLVEVFSRNADEWQALCTLQAVTTDNELVKFIFEDNALEMSRREAITADIARRGVIWNAELRFSLILIFNCALYQNESHFLAVN
ncbi:hypothetical protein KJE20_03542 [Pyrenophora tritici-repentis]|uniref:Uncharacterized protein n=1 Tax=Pyrenophora tritici-repentis TaxID=45151 RepID=A0A922N1U4_9PLEO|nr:hypothetical protein Ptr86124_012980 [Pyrenophora tritici-repentis]KAI1558202.1 hypothetical protein PtrEW7m1_012120 [Pyrenophora tritici-repentis]KAI1690364.1 hypothetical protein KJE20_03542 [Pyrenophora tritici-repentis]